jgi:peptidoglycan glycosyltransferase
MLSPQGLAALGGGQIAYVRPIRSDDLNRLFPQAPEIQPGLDLFALLGADGSPLMVTDSRAAAIANAGVVMQPYLVDHIQGPDLSDVSTTQPQEQQRAVSPQVAAKLTDLMVAAEKFTQQQGAIPGVQIASKTGTAEHGTDPRNTPPHAWYVAFAPAQNPRVAIAVLVENGGDRLSATGGALAAPIGRATISAVLQGSS